MTYKIVKVEYIKGQDLKPFWKCPMQKIFLSGFEDFFIDTLPYDFDFNRVIHLSNKKNIQNCKNENRFTGTYWEQFIGQEIDFITVPNNKKFDYFWMETIEHQNYLSTNKSISEKDKTAKGTRIGGYEPTIRTEDGHFVRSKAEAIIDNYLYNKNIVHVYEKKLPIKENVFSDFFIPTINGSNPIYIEFWGLEDIKYLNRKKVKQEIYFKNNLNLIEIDEKMVRNLDDFLPQLLLKHNLKID